MDSTIYTPDNQAGASLPPADPVQPVDNVTPTVSPTVSPTVPPPTAPQYQTEVVPETFVVSANPAQDQNMQNNSQNSFIPQGIGASQVPAQSVAVPSRGSGGGFGKRLVTLLVALLVLVGLVGGGYAVFLKFMGGQSVTLTYWGLWENDSIIRPLISAYEAKHPNVKITYLANSPKQYRQRLQAAIDRGDGPDVFRFHNTWVSLLRNELSLVPKEVMTTSEFTSSFYPVAARDLVGGGNIFGIPLEIDGLGLYYNEDLFAAAGISAPPTTWEELLQMVPKIARAEGTGFSVSAIALGTTNNIENFSDILATMFMQNGANLLDLKGQEAEQVLTFYKKFSDPNDPVYTWNDSLDNSMYAFASGRVAMILAPSWRAFDVKTINSKLQFKIAPIPQLPGNSVTWASYWVEGVSKKSAHQKEAWEFVKYLSSKDAETKLYTEASKVRLFGEPYSRTDMASLLTEDPYVGAYIKQATSAKSFPFASRTFDEGINDKMNKYMEDMVNSLSTGQSPQGALQQANAGFKQVLSTYGLSSGSVPTTP
jgi:multiple sugar transport system substrate-binding protein